MSTRMIDPAEKMLDMAARNWYTPLDMKDETNRPAPGADKASASVLSPPPQADSPVAPGAPSCHFCGSTEHQVLESDPWWDCPNERNTSTHKSGETGFWDENMAETPTWCSGYHDQQKKGKALGLFHRTPDSRKNQRLNLSEY